MAKQQLFAAPATPTDASGSRERDTSHWRTGLKAAASILRGAIRYAGLRPIPKSAMAYYSGVSDVGDPRGTTSSGRISETPRPPS